MTVRLADRGLSVVLLDIEGTTTPIAFVHDVLFPYARTHLTEWLAASDRDTRLDVARRLSAEHAEDERRGESVPAWHEPNTDIHVASMTAYVSWLMDRDRKSPALKWLQGLIWERGYQAGELRGDVFPDVAPALARWHTAGLRVAIYSSGSELAQRRLFASTLAGDLTDQLAGFFDTAVGPKTSSDSYRRIAEAFRCDPGAILFVSDVARELEAARAAGCQVLLSLRPGNPPQPEPERFEAVRSFDDIV